MSDTQNLYVSPKRTSGQRGESEYTEPSNLDSSTLADFSLPIACPDLDYFRFADNSVLFVGATNLIPPVSTSSLAAGRHNRKNQLDR